MLCCGLMAAAQKMTSYEPAKFNFESEPAGATVFFQGKVLGITPFSAEVKPAYRTINAEPGQSEFQTYTANSLLIENEIAASGQDNGTLSQFQLEFVFVMPDGSNERALAPLMWRPASLLGLDGISIYYPPLLRVSQPNPSFIRGGNVPDRQAFM